MAGELEVWVEGWLLKSSHWHPAPTGHHQADLEAGVEARKQGLGRSGPVWAGYLEEESGGCRSQYLGAEVRAGRE